MSDTLRQEPMSNVDAAWRFMEEPSNLMMVSGLMYFEERVEPEDLSRIIKERLLQHKRFRQRVVDPDSSLKNPHWEDVDDLDFEYHIQHEHLPQPGNYDIITERVNQLISTPLDFSKPLWQIHILDNYYEGNLVMTRLHHCIADGIALMSVLLSLAGETPEDSLAPLDKPNHPLHLSSTGNLFQKAGGTLLKVMSKPSKLFDLAKLGAASALSATKLVLKSFDPPTPLRGDLGIPKVAAWSRAIPLEDIKRIKNVTKSTVNDVLLTAMAGGLRRYLQDHREFDTHDLDFRAAVPVNLRPPEQATKLGNHFGLVFLSLPVGIAEPLDRLFELKKRMDAIKNSPEAIVAFGILKAVGMTPVDIQRALVNVFGKKSTCVMTNVPGPRDHLFLAGKKIDSMMFWVPCSGRVGMGVSILSYAGQVRLGLATDHGLVPDPRNIIKGFYKELDAMMELVTQVENENKD